MGNEEEQAVVAPLGKGRKQKEEVSAAGGDPKASAGEALKAEDGVGEVHKVVNPALRSDVQFNKFDKDGNVESYELFEAGKLHLVSKELADAKAADGTPYFVDPKE